MPANASPGSRFSSTIKDAIPRARMLDELWRRIFEEVLEEKRRSHAVTPFLLVCKTWKVACSDLIYRYLGFLKIESLESFHLHLVSEAIKGHYPGLSTRAIFVHLKDNVSFSALIPKILLYTVNLTSFRAPKIDVCSSVLENLCYATKGALKELSLTLCTHNTDGAINLALISRCADLEKLSVIVPGVINQSRFPISRVPGLCMPSLTALTWSTPNSKPVDDFLVFLSRCELQSLTRLNLDLPFLDRDGTLAIRPFLAKVGSQLRRLVLNVPDGAMVPNLLFPFTTKLQELEFPKRLPPSETVKNLPPSLERLVLHIDLKEGLTKLLKFLDDLDDDLPHDSSLGFVQLSKMDDKPFEWWTIGRKDVSIAGQLLSRSIWFARKGIEILDSHENTVVMIS